MKRTLLLLATLGLYLATAYGGIRSPDSEVNYRTAAALQDGGTFAVENELEAWPGFGLARGRDDRLYSIFGPLQPVLLAPWLRALEPLADGHANPPASFYVERDSLARHATGRPPVQLPEHARRSLAALWNVLVTALLVQSFYGLVYSLFRSTSLAFFGGLLLALDTPFWSYSGTLFSEPLAAWLVVLSLRSLVDLEKDYTRAARSLFTGGLWLGLASTAHLTAILFAPFFAGYAWVKSGAHVERGRDRLFCLLSFCAGMLPALLALALFNWMRFENPFETGRGVDPELARSLGYGTWTDPLPGLRGFAIGASKSLFLFAPLALVGLLSQRTFARRHGALCAWLLLAFLGRALFLAARSDWHGGFALGPRYLMLALPILLVPFLAWTHECLRRGSRGGIAVACLVGALAMVQQAYFALGEIFLFYFRSIRITAASKGRDEEPHDLYDDWDRTPLTDLLSEEHGAFLLRNAPASNLVLWALLALATLLLALRAWLYLNASLERHTPTAPKPEPGPAPTH